MKHEITYETVITLQRIAEWFEQINSGSVELHYGGGWRNMTIRDIQKRLPDLANQLNTARVNVIDCWERDE